MTGQNILEQIGIKGADIDDIADSLLKDRKQIPGLVEALKAEKSSKKFAYEKTLRLLAAREPKLVYPYFEVFSDMLSSENSFLKWGAILTLANLTPADVEHKFEKIFREYYAPIQGPAMITAANIIAGSATIVRARPELADAVAKEILKVEKANFLRKGAPSPECRNVAIGQAIDTFDRIYEHIGAKGTVRKFIRRQLANRRKQVAGKAERFLKKRGHSTYIRGIRGT